MVDRFDLEQNIMKCWNVTDDIDMVYSNVMDRDMSKDEIANALLGLQALYNMKFEELWENFEQLIKDKKLV